MKRLDWYFDFISPFSYLQSALLDRIAEHAEVRLRPVLFAGLLDHWGTIGPAELATKRIWTYEHCVWLAHRHGIPFTMPSAHPFNPLPLLRLSIAVGNTRESVARLFRFVWQEGHTPADGDAWDALLDEFRIDEEKLRTAEVKTSLRDNGADAIAAGAFGVPTSVVDGRLFWGFDATEMVIDYLRDDALFDSATMQRAADTPTGVTRPGVRGGGAA